MQGRGCPTMIQACSQKFLLKGSFEGNVDFFLLQPTSPESVEEVIWCVHSPHS